MTEQVQIHVNFNDYYQMNGNLNSKIEDRISYVDVPIDVSKFEKFMKWWNKGGKLDGLDNSTLNEYVEVIKSLKLAFDEVFSDINCTISHPRYGSCNVQFGPFTFYNNWTSEEFTEMLKKIEKTPNYNSIIHDIDRLAATELKAKNENLSFSIIPFVTISTDKKSDIKKLQNSEILDKERKLYNKLFPSYIKPILVGLGGVLVSLIVGYAAHILANPDKYNQNGGSKKRFSGGNSIKELINNGINQTGLTEDQIKELNQITTAEDLKNFIDKNLQKLSKEEKEKIKKELKNKLSREQKKIINKDFPGFDLKDDETVFGFLGEKFLGGKQGGKPLTKRHRKKRQNKKRKSRKSKK